jgi:hypothetical protein
MGALLEAQQYAHSEGRHCPEADRAASRLANLRYTLQRPTTGMLQMVTALRGSGDFSSSAAPLPWASGGMQHSSSGSSSNSSRSIAASSSDSSNSRGHVTGHITRHVSSLSSSNRSAAAGSSAVSRGAAPQPANDSSFFMELIRAWTHVSDQPLQRLPWLSAALQFVSTTATAGTAATTTARGMERSCQKRSRGVSLCEQRLSATACRWHRYKQFG